jgi:hypothetical protein
LIRQEDSMPSYKLYRSHNCTANHRTHRAMAKCIWKRAEWITGDGPYALLAHCRVLTVTLHQRPETAEAGRQTIDETACGGACYGKHEIIQLVLP